MGRIGPFRSSSSNYTSPNPNPYRFEIIKLISLDNVHTLVRLKYEGCTTYEGEKIAIYDKAPNDIRHRNFLDPHFSDSEHLISPIARFPASTEGEIHAMQFLEMLAREKD